MLDTSFLSNKSTLLILEAALNSGNGVTTKDVEFTYSSQQQPNTTAMPLEVRQVEKGDIAQIARMDRVVMRDVGISNAIWKIQEEEGIDITYSFERFISTGMEHHAETFWKVVDSESNEMISVAKFTFQYHQGEGYQDTPVEGEQPPPKRLMDFFKSLNKKSNKFAEENLAGRPHART